MENPIKKYNLYTNNLFATILKDIMVHTSVSDASSYEEKAYFLNVANKLLDKSIKQDERIISSYTFAPRLQLFFNGIKVENDNEQKQLDYILPIVDELIKYQLATCPKEEEWYWHNIGLM